MYYVTRRIRFAASHRLPKHPGRCKNLHGHNWLVEACWSCPELLDNGMVVDFEVLDKLLHKCVYKVYDHQHLNDCVPFRHGHPPTAENLAGFIHVSLRLETKRKLNPKVVLHAVRVWENENSSVEYQYTGC